MQKDLTTRTRGRAELAAKRAVCTYHWSYVQDLGLSCRILTFGVFELVLYDLSALSIRGTHVSQLSACNGKANVANHLLWF